MKVLLLSFILIFVSASGFAFRGGSGTVGPGNPAAIFCDQVGGEVKILRTPKWHEYSVCLLGEAIVETFTLYSHVYKPNSQMAINVYLEGSMHPAPNGEEYCLHVDGQVEVMRDSQGHSVRLCQFSDGSLIEAETLFRGPLSPKNQKLNEFLKSLK